MEKCREIHFIDPKLENSCYSSSGIKGDVLIYTVYVCAKYAPRQFFINNCLMCKAAECKHLWISQLSKCRYLVQKSGLLPLSSCTSLYVKLQLGSPLFTGSNKYLFFWTSDMGFIYVQWCKWIIKLLIYRQSKADAIRQLLDNGR